MNPIAMDLPFSETLKYTQLAQKLREEGHDVVSLTAGEPDFDTPAPIVQAAVEALNEGFTRYTASSGIMPLRKGISAYLQRHFSLDYAPDEIVVSNGGKHALFNIFFALLSPGDEVLLFTPDWVSYVPQIRLCGATPVLVPTQIQTGFMPDPQVVNEMITPQTKAMVINSPNNPAGIVYPRNLLQELAEIAKAHDLWVISDEIYATLVYESAHESIAQIEGMRSRTVVINGFSKSHAMTGWRCGYSAAPIALTQQVGKIQSHLTSNINSITQKAAMKALEIDNADMREAFRHRRDFICHKLTDLGIAYGKVDGAFYVFMDFRPYLDRFGNDDQLATHLLEAYGIGLVPGSAFHMPGFMRMSFAASDTQLSHGIEKLRRFITQTPGSKA